MKKISWKTDIPLNNRRKRNQFKMFLRQRYLCTESASYCKKSYFLCPDRFQCNYHYLSLRKRWYSVPSNYNRLFAKLRRLYGEKAVEKIQDIIAKEKQGYDIHLDTIDSLLNSPTYRVPLNAAEQ